MLLPTPDVDERKRGSVCDSKSRRPPPLCLLPTLPTARRPEGVLKSGRRFKGSRRAAQVVLDAGLVCKLRVRYRQYVCSVSICTCSVRATPRSAVIPSEREWREWDMASVVPWMACSGRPCPVLEETKRHR